MAAHQRKTRASLATRIAIDILLFITAIRSWDAIPHITIIRGAASTGRISAFSITDSRHEAFVCGRIASIRARDDILVLGLNITKLASFITFLTE